MFRGENILKVKFTGEEIQALKKSYVSYNASECQIIYNASECNPNGQDGRKDLVIANSWNTIYQRKIQFRTKGLVDITVRNILIWKINIELLNLRVIWG